MLRARGFAVVEHDPAIVRVAIGTTQRVPSWPGTHERPRLLVEVPGGRWHAEEAARAAGFQVLACPGPLLGWSHCPALRGEPCPLAAGADVIVDAVPDEPGRSLLEAHRRIHPSVPICVELPSGESDLDAAVSTIPRGASDAAVVGILERLAKDAPVRGRPQRKDAGQIVRWLVRRLEGSGWKRSTVTSMRSAPCEVGRQRVPALQGTTASFAVTPKGVVRGEVDTYRRTSPWPRLTPAQPRRLRRGVRRVQLGVCPGGARRSSSGRDQHRPTRPSIATRSVRPAARSRSGVCAETAAYATSRTASSRSSRAALRRRSTT